MNKSIKKKLLQWLVVEYSKLHENNKEYFDSLSRRESKEEWSNPNNWFCTVIPEINWAIKNSKIVTKSKTNKVNGKYSVNYLIPIKFEKQIMKAYTNIFEDYISDTPPPISLTIVDKK